MKLINTLYEMCCVLNSKVLNNQTNMKGTICGI